MLCPECRFNTLEPIYTKSIDPYISDTPHAPHAPARQDIRMFRCTHCLSYYNTYGNENAAEAYWRIINDYAKD